METITIPQLRKAAQLAADQSRNGDKHTVTISGETGITMLTGAKIPPLAPGIYLVNMERYEDGKPVGVDGYPAQLPIYPESKQPEPEPAAATPGVKTGGDIGLMMEFMRQQSEMMRMTYENQIKAADAARLADREREQERAAAQQRLFEDRVKALLEVSGEREKVIRSAVEESEKLARERIDRAVADIRSRENTGEAVDIEAILSHPTVVQIGNALGDLASGMVKRWLGEPVTPVAEKRSVGDIVGGFLGGNK